MTTAIKPYRLHDVPATGDERSRWAIGSTPNGWSSSPAETVSLALNALGLERKREAVPLQPAQVVVSLRRVAITADGEYVLVGRGSIVGTPTRESVRSGKFSKLEKGGALLDDVFLGGPAYLAARDEDIWEALRLVCEQTGATGNTLRQLNIDVALLVALRAGLELEPSRLPS